MPRVMTLWLPRWPVQRRLLERPELRRVPLFVCRRERRGVMTVVSWAWAMQPRADGLPSGRRSPVARIPPGMSLAEAMAVLAITHGSRACHMAEVDHDDPVADRSALEQTARSCRRFAPIVALEEAERPECLHVDVTGTADFFGGEGLLARTAVWTLAARGIHARAAIADTPGAAWAAAHHTDRHTDRLGPQSGAVRGNSGNARRRRWAVVPKGEHSTTLSPLPAESLRLPAGLLSQLREVGVDTIGGVLRLPRKSLDSRFSPELSRRLAQFTGAVVEPLVQAFGDELPQAAHDFDFPLSMHDSFDGVVGEVLGQLVAACVGPLAAQGKGITGLQVRLERELCGGWLDGHAGESLAACRADSTRPPIVIEIGLFRPSASVKHILDLIRLRMARLRLPREIGGVAVDVVSAGVSTCRQRMLFGEATESAATEVGMLLDRLSGRLGRSAVFEPRPIADAQPEHAWVGVPPSATRIRRSAAAARSNATPQRRPGIPSERRPIWLSPRPVLLEAVSVMPDGPPVRFRFGSQVHDVVRAHGPERIETAWWRGPIVRRDYYVVETTSGGRFWLFRRLRDGGWFLHGMFG
jgi:protein ImuB